ncbi:hypothetical protein NAL32_20125 [Chryseobacterium sp. Ch-15]|uniref:Uncharacterized protein n=1 Tax=Chryseobacterium muglaense TaxID=2893752 RepID=A0A9Q3YST4_9FLAO|nr:DUF6624 domain-containing protein [Chryseobacterium muglaense]MBD3906990.1 hypothetical protein [Chryseobacterium muglaense]MCC9036396.1 hypothetical protein [Chryseobacterium muglaense]MCM2556704.1 hypothetical protein [Chryseobacterium muglaense]
MKHLPLLLFPLLIGCSLNKEINENDRKKVIAELDYIEKIDQKYARIPSEDLINKYGQQKAWEIFSTKRDSVSIDNQAKIKKLFSKYGYLGFNKVGKENSTKFWLPIQHADNDVEFQKQMLQELKKQIELKNANRNEYAMLEDRVAVNTNQKQRFGSQVTYNSNGQAIPRNGLIDSVNIEKLRAEYDLPIFKDYYNNMTIMHFEMNKEILIKQGISEPKLYK